MIVYFSNVTGFTQRFVEKLDTPSMRIPLQTASAESFEISEDFVLVVPTYGAGSKGFVPKQVVKFLNNPQNRLHIKGVIATGNTNFGEDYCRAGTIVADKCRVPLLYRLELSGTDDDVNTVNEGMRKLKDE